jgi:hypothetical protein
VDAALGAEVMLDGVVAECVGGKVLFGGKQAKLVSRNEPMKRTHPRADRAIAVGSLIEFALNLECDLATVTAAFVVHCVAPLIANWAW